MFPHEPDRFFNNEPPGADGITPKERKVKFIIGYFLYDWHQIQPREAQDFDYALNLIYSIEDWERDRILRSWSEVLREQLHEHLESQREKTAD